jgi:HEAT repeat protein
MDKAQIKTQGLAFGRSVQTAFKTVVMYSVDHPAAGKALQQAYDTLNTLLQLSPQFTFGYTDHRILLNDLLTDDPILVQLESEFTRRGIAAITFLGGISLVEFKQALTILATRSKDIEAKGGITPYLAEHPLSHARVVPAKKQEDGDTQLDTDAESFLLGEKSQAGQGPGGMSGMDALLRFAQTEGEADALQKGTDILEMAGKATEAALLGQSTDPQEVVGTLARLLEEVTPDQFLSALPTNKQSLLRGQSAENIASDVVEDVTVRLVSNRLAAAPPGPEAVEAESEAIRVMTVGLSMTSMSDRLLEKLARALNEANLPPEVLQRIRQSLAWNGLSQEAKREELLKATEYDAQRFKRLLDYVKECLQARKYDEAVQVATPYFNFLDSPSPVLQAELPRALELLRLLAEPPTLAFVSAMTERLGRELLDARPLTRESHSLLADCLAEVIQMLVPHGDFESVHRAGSALEQSLARDPQQHAECCGKALGRLLPPEAATRLIDLYVEKRGDVGLAKTTLKLLQWLGVASGEEAFRRLAEETTPNRMLLLRLLAQMGPVGIGAARKRVADERWYVVRDACVVLGELDDPDIAQQLRDPLRHAEARVQQAAVTALVKSHAPEAIASLANALPTLEGGVAEKVLEELSFRKDPAIVDGLEKFIYLSKGTKPAALEKAVQALAVIPSERAARVLGAVLSDPGHTPFVRRAAAEKLLRSTQPVAKRFLEAYVHVAPTDPIAVAIQRTLQRETSR